MMRYRSISILVAICTILLLLSYAPRALAQDPSQSVPQGMNYQAVVRDSLGLPLSNRTVGVRISILSGSSASASVYTETHVVTTDDLGLFTLVIGRGTATVGSFDAVDWKRRDYWLKTEID